MECKLIARRGNSLLVQKGDMFYFLDMMSETWQSNPDPNVFFKFEYFEEITPEDEANLPEVERILADQH